MQCPECGSARLKRHRCHETAICLGWSNPRRIPVLYYECLECGEFFESELLEDPLEPLDFDNDHGIFDDVSLETYFFNPYEVRKSYM